MLRAVTFDFWGTLVDGEATAERVGERLARLHAAITGAGFACSLEELRTARLRVEERVGSVSPPTYEDVGPPGRWAAVAHELGVPAGAIPFEIIERTYEEITFDPLPRLMPHVYAAVAAVRAAGCRTAVICNTGMAGGRTLREVLRRRGLLECFEVTVFSNEFGWAKPDPRIFEHTLNELGVSANQALHVGDLEELDVEGARRAGMHAALYAPGTIRKPATEADFVVADWRQFAGELGAFRAALNHRAGF